MLGFFLRDICANLKPMMAKSLIKKFIPGFLLDFYHWFLALAGAVIFGFPSRKVILIGGTGTNGKSTTVDFLARILEESGNKTASLSSVRFKIKDNEWRNNLKMTMPGRFAVQKFLRQAIKGGCKYAVLEVTSEGIRQHRHKFINFDAAIFTNLSPEHIESHGGFENYRNEKLKLFSAGGGSAFGGKATMNPHIINIDEENAKYFLNIPAKKIITFGISGRQNQSNILKNVGMIAKDVKDNNFTVNGVRFSLNLLGDFNVYNALAAIAAAKNYGISLDICKKALEKIKGIQGRMEIIQKKPFLVVVDYAHTPVQLEKIYQVLNPKPPTRNASPAAKTAVGLSGWRSDAGGLNPRLICVLGSCGGGRDKWKRPALGEIASRYCEEIILTNEDPYDENPLSIMNEIESGFPQIQKLKYEKILDRKEAIKKAISIAKLNDIVIITGKGSETLMCLENGKKIPWSDKAITRESLKAQ